jgi:hypothetical protein
VLPDSEFRSAIAALAQAMAATEDDWWIIGSRAARRQSWAHR